MFFAAKDDDGLAPRPLFGILTDSFTFHFYRLDGHGKVWKVMTLLTNMVDS